MYRPNFSQEIINNALPRDCREFNRIKVFTTFITYALRHELLNKYKNNEYINWCQSMAVEENSAKHFFARLLGMLYSVDNINTRHPLSLIYQLSEIQHFEELFRCNVKAVYTCKCKEYRTKESSLWSVNFSENDNVIVGNTIGDVVQFGWKRPTQHRCNRCSQPFNLNCFVKNVSRFLVIDFTRGAPKNRIDITNKFTMFGETYILKAYAMKNNVISIRIEGTHCDENLFGEYFEGTVNVAEKVLNASELKNETLDLLIYEKI